MLGMYDESILILEDIPPSKERWDSLVVEARYNTYRDAEVWELANAMSGLMCRRHPSSLKWCMNYVDGMIKLGETKEAIEALEESRIGSQTLQSIFLSWANVRQFWAMWRRRRNWLSRQLRRMPSTSWSLLRTQRSMGFGRVFEWEDLSRIAVKAIQD